MARQFPRSITIAMNRCNKIFGAYKLFLSLTFLLFLYTAQAQREHIINFHADIQIDTTSTIEVVENIKVYASGNRIKRGIFRSLPLHRNVNEKRRKIHYKIISIKKDGEEEDYHQEEKGDFLLIYVGSKNNILPRGEYRYEIAYTADNQIGFFQNYDELYWNVNGNAWDFPAEQVSATVRLPIGAQTIQTSCYTGTTSSTEADCAIVSQTEDQIVWQAEMLAPGEGLTVAVGFTKGIVKAPPPPTMLQKWGLLIAALVTLAILFIYYFISWKQYGVDPPKPVPYPQFNTPDNLSPASLGYVHSEKFNNKLLTGALVSLAVKGYISIGESVHKTLGIFKKTYFTLTKLKEAQNSLPEEESQLLANLFASANSVKLDGTYNSNIETAVQSFKHNMGYKHKNLLEKGANNKLMVLPYLLCIIFFLIAMLTMNFEFGNNINYFIVAVFILIPLIVALLTTNYILRQFTWTWWLFALVAALIIFIFCAILFLKADAITIFKNYFVLAGFVIISFISLVVYRYLIRRPSEEKLAIQAEINGFKMYLETAEEKLLQFFNPPAITPQVFEALLPYAMVLGVDRIWGEKFQSKMLAMAQQPYQSDWYNGPSLTPVLMGNALSNSMSQSITSAATPPSSSSSSFGSGSGGGGFSGGGGGGGGGGGW